MRGFNGRPERRGSGRCIETAGAEKIFREVESGAKTDRAQLRRVLNALHAGDISWSHGLIDSTRDLHNVLSTIAEKHAGFRSLADTWADTTKPHGRLMLTMLGGLADLMRGGLAC